MGVNTGALNAAVDAATALLTYASIHTAAPDAGGSNEVAGGGYARQAVTWGAASGAVASASALTFAGPAGGDAKYIGFWSAASGGTFRGSKALTGDQTFNAAGQYQVTSLTMTGTSPA